VFLKAETRLRFSNVNAKAYLTDEFLVVLGSKVIPGPKSYLSHDHISLSYWFVRLQNLKNKEHSSGQRADPSTHSSRAAPFMAYLVINCSTNEQDLVYVN
jgi:hypothetical protein